VSNDRGAAQALEDPYLDLVRPQSPQLIEATRKARLIFTWQTNDQVDVQVRRGIGAQPPHVVLELSDILAPGNALAGGIVKGLHTDLKLQTARRDGCDLLAQRIGQPIGNELEVQEHALLPAFAEEPQNLGRAVDAQIEGAIDKLEVADAALQQSLHRS